MAGAGLRGPGSPWHLGWGGCSTQWGARQRTGRLCALGDAASGLGRGAGERDGFPGREGRRTCAQVWTGDLRARTSFWSVSTCLLARGLTWGSPGPEAGSESWLHPASTPALAQGGKGIRNSICVSRDICRKVKSTPGGEAVLLLWGVCRLPARGRRWAHEYQAGTRRVRGLLGEQRACPGLQPDAGRGGWACPETTGGRQGGRGVGQ